jgi:hypothetical protein
MGGAYSTYGRDEISTQILVGKPEGKRQFGNLREVWRRMLTNCGRVNWSHLLQGGNR